MLFMCIFFLYILTYIIWQTTISRHRVQGWLQVPTLVFQACILACPNNPKGPPSRCLPQVRRKYILWVLVISILLLERANLGFTISIKPRGTSKICTSWRLKWVCCAMFCLDGDVVFIRSKQVYKTGPRTLI